MNSNFVLTGDGDERTAVLSGDWTGGDAGRTGAALRQATGGARRLRLDLTQIQRLDTAGALSILRAVNHRVDADAIVAKPEIHRLIDLVARARRPEPPPPPRAFPPLVAVASVGRRAFQFANAIIGTLGFMGHLTISLARGVVDPRRIRWAAFASQAEIAGLDALPIIALTSAFIGMVVGMLGMHMLERFGARILTPELTGAAVLREFGVVITAVILAGRSGSAFAAELGSMRMQREIDAMIILAVDPAEALVLPRIAALLFTMPLLCIVADICGLAGGMFSTWLAVGLSPLGFVARLQDYVGVTHFWVGMSKTPIMAVVIACIGCHQGFEAGGDVESLGRHVTAAVVHAIFAIIMIDAAFALIYLKLNI